MPVLSSLSRRAFFSNLLLGIPAIALAQDRHAIIEKKQSVICDGSPLTCPNGHTTCPTINATMTVGNENQSYPETAVLFEFHQVRCDVCHVLFTRE
jgi:hypothetical protein